MSVFLSQLVPTTGLAVWYPLDNDAVGATALTDESSPARNATAVPPGIDVPQITADQIDGRKAVVFNDNADFFASSGVLTPLKHIFAVVKVDGASFGANDQGLVTANAAAAAIDAFVGTAGTTKWGNPSVFSAYYKSGTSFATSNMQAPFSYFEQIEGVYAPSSEFTDGVQLGQVRETTTKRFKGKLADLMIFTTALDAADRVKLKLYADLKFGLWLLNGTALTFPTPEIVGLHGYSHFEAFPEFKGLDDTTASHPYEDGGESFNRATDTPPREWLVTMDALGSTHAESKLKTDVYDAFAAAVGIDRPFSFTDKYGVTHTNVRIKRGGYSRSHEANRSWTQPVSFRLKKAGV